MTGTERPVRGRLGGSLATARERNPLPEGTVAVGVGLAVTGIASYAFLVISARALGPAKYGSLSVLWSLVFLVAGGVFLPLEQEVSRRIVTLRVQGDGAREVIFRIGALGLAVAVVLAVVAAALGGVLRRDLFGGDGWLVVGLILGVFGYMVANFVEGVFSGNRRFGRYSAYLGGEASARLAVCLLCVIAGIRHAGPYGLALGTCPLLMCVPLIWGQHSLAEPGPTVPWGELASALGLLLAGAFLSQVIINSLPILVRVLGHGRHHDQVGAFAAAVVIARVPLFLFQALQATMLPGLSRLAARHEFNAFVNGTRRLLILLGGLAALAIALAFVVGPSIVSVIFGRGFVISRITIGTLAIGSGLYMIAMTLGQGLIALSEGRLTAVGWLVGVVAMAIALALGRDPVARVQYAFVIGAGASTATMGVALARNPLLRSRSVGQPQ